MVFGIVIVEQDIWKGCALARAFESEDCEQVKVAVKSDRFWKTPNDMLSPVLCPVSRIASTP